MQQQQQQQQQLGHMGDAMGEVELGTNSGMSGTLDHGCDASSLPLSVSSDTAFTSFYGSQANLKHSRSQARIPQGNSNSNLHESSCPSGTLRSTWSPR